MKSLYQLWLTVLLAAFLLAGCDGEAGSLVDSRLADNPEPETEQADSGTADFSRPVMIGNSLTAGFMDAALYDLAQQNSLAVRLGQQLSLAGGPETINQPNINSANGFNASASNPDEGVILGRFKLDTSIPGPSPLVEGDLPQPFEGDVSTLNNFGVPGVVLGQLLTPQTAVPDSPAFNPLYARFASSPGSSTILGDAIATDPTFFSLWIGNNDVLGYALQGGVNPDAITATSDFQAQFGEVVNQLTTQTEAKGVVGLIPNLLTVPVFRAVPYNAVELDQATADMLNEALSTLNAVYAGMAGSNIGVLANFGPEDEEQRRLEFQAGNNPVLIHDPDILDIGPLLDFLVAVSQINEEQRAALEPYRQARPMKVDAQLGPELLLLSAASVLGTLADPDNPQSQIGVVIPLQPQFHLTHENMIQIETARQTFNTIMTSVVAGVNEASAETRIAVYNPDDTNSRYARIFGLDGSQVGIQIGPQRLAPDFSPSGVFSTDGVHPNSRGYALLANDIIDAIEVAFDARIPRISNSGILNLPSVQLCAGDCLSEQGTRPVREYIRLDYQYQLP